MAVAIATELLWLAGEGFRVAGFCRATAASANSFAAVASAGFTGAIWETTGSKLSTLTIRAATVQRAGRAVFADLAVAVAVATENLALALPRDAACAW